jgi:hypothetical protein
MAFSYEDPLIMERNPDGMKDISHANVQHLAY